VGDFYAIGGAGGIRRVMAPGDRSQRSLCLQDENLPREVSDLRLGPYLDVAIGSRRRHDFVDERIRIEKRSKCSKVVKNCCHVFKRELNLRDARVRRLHMTTPL